MSGIVGLYHLDGQPVERTALDGMLGAIAHRGPDGTASWREGPVGLGHQMLHSTPESLHERLPLTDGSGRLTITADLRIDNRDELIRRLDPPRSIGTPVTDSELVLAAYRKWGVDCPEHLLGAFAFALWDAREQRLFCARDHLGVKPLFYYHAPGRFLAVGSEIKTLLSLPAVPEVLNEEQLAGYLTVKLLDAEQTGFKEIFRLPPGQTLTVSPNDIRRRKYWKASPTTEGIPTEDEACAQRFLELFTEAVLCRVRSSHPVGSELSGGLDSSFVTCMARDLLGSDEDHPFPTISTVFDRFPQCDERSYIKEVVEQGGIEPHFSSAEERGILDVLDEIYDYLDDGHATGNTYLNWLSFSAARNAGLRVLLTGQDGDTTVGHGWRHFRTLAREERWEEFAREAAQCTENRRGEQDAYALQLPFRSPRDILNAYGGLFFKKWAVHGNYLRFVRSANQVHKWFGVRRREVYRRFWRDLVLPSSIAETRFQREETEKARRAVPKIINPDLAKRIHLAERLAAHRGDDAPDSSMRESQLYRLRSAHLTYALEEFELYGAACGVEARHPFMDIRLIEFCVALPPTQSLSHGWTRSVMRRAMEGIVPDRIRKRAGKSSLSAPYVHLLLHKDERELQKLLDGLDEVAVFLNVPYLKGLIEDKQSISEGEISEVGLGLGLALWLKKRKNWRKGGSPLLFTRPVPAR